MLIVPNFETLGAWATGEKIAFADAASLVRHPEVHAKVEREVRNALRDLAKYEMPKKLLLLPRDFSIESGELTPKLSVKRKVVEQHHAAAIEALYAE